MMHFIRNGKLAKGLQLGIIFVVSGALLLSMLVTHLKAQAASPANWNMFGYNALHTHLNPNEHTLGTGNVGAITQAWHFTTGAAIDSSPAIVNGVAYIGSTDNNLYAVNTTTGAALWHFTAGSMATMSPAVVNGIVYFGSDNGTFYALRARTGRLLWSRFITSRGVASSPTVVGGVVYFAGGDQYIYALRATTGAVIWKSFTGPDQGVFDSSPAVVGGVLYVLSFDLFA
ncbi:MAG: PQQ-like beta-propeller repeat protein, partial [Ktedonobacteraceae bacterium]|nr:PQQ-like beta-propeller repeat protein [Ktedonobacteraceae bacterium]